MTSEGIIAELKDVFESRAQTMEEGDLNIALSRTRFWEATQTYLLAEILMELRQLNEKFVDFFVSMEPEELKKGK